MHIEEATKAEMSRAEKANRQYRIQHLAVNSQVQQLQQKLLRLVLCEMTHTREKGQQSQLAAMWPNARASLNEKREDG